MFTPANQKDIETIVKSAKKFGITNKFALPAYLSILYKESKFIPKRENMNYSANRIKQIWPRLSSQASQLANNPEALANAAYGGKYGNGPLEGYKFRGGGLNQITFKSNFEKYGKKIGVDLVANPDKITDLKVAADVAAIFAIEGIEALKKSGKLADYNANDINGFQSSKDALQAFYHANAGPGKSTKYIKSLDKKDPIKGYTTAKSVYDEIAQYIGDFPEKKK